MPRLDRFPFEARRMMFGDWLTKLDFANWMAIVSTSLGVILALGVFLMARRIVGQPQSAAADSSAEPEGDGPRDPFIHGSASEKRVSLRRVGNPKDIAVSDDVAAVSPWSGLITDRSIGGVRVVQDDYVPIGTRLSVRPKGTSRSAPWTQVEVRHCRKTTGGWELGCTFVRTPSSANLVDFG